jgi:hypothetical protein
MPFESTRTRPHRGPVRHWALGLLAATLLLTGCESQADKDKKLADTAYREKLAKAKAIFAERCKTAGVVIHRTVKDVEGISINKVRPTLEFADKRYFDPMWPEAAMATEARGDDYIKQFLLSELSPSSYEPNRRGNLFPSDYKIRIKQPNQYLKRGFRYVDLIDPAGRTNERITLLPHPSIEQTTGPLKRAPIKTAPARYLLDFEDLVDPVDRAYWVAGTKLRVIDQKNGEVIAEMTRFVLEAGFGSNASGRWAWQMPSSSLSLRCQGDANQPTTPVSRYFVDTVLIPKQGD